MTTSRHGVRWADHVVEVPLRAADPGGERIAVYAREVVREDLADAGLPRLLYLQGGPGSPADRPGRDHQWLPRALEEFRVVLLDQRGTGRSTPLRPEVVRARGSARDQAEFLTHFRADAIVRDAEALRRELQGAVPWSVLGQSFGGWCATTYLSFAPEGLREVLITGGLPSLTADADAVYRAAYPRVIARDHAYFDAFPQDAERVAALAELLRATDVRMPRGERLTVRRLQSAGNELGTTAGFETMHFLLEQAFPAGAAEPIVGDAFTAALDAIVSLAGRPIFALLHEPLYSQGAGSAPRWSAQRIRAEFPELAEDAGRPPFFTGEMIYPWMFEEDPTLVPYADAAHALAEWDEWPPLFDERTLRSGGVPVNAMIYTDDLYVDAEMSRATAALIGARTIERDDLEHDALRKGTALGPLLEAARHA